MEEDWQRERNIYKFQKVKKTTQTGLEASSSHSTNDDDVDEDSSNDDGSYGPFDTEALPTIPMNTFQAEMRATFEQLAEIVESFRCYADELAY